MPRPPSILLALALGAAVLVLSSCGEDDAQLLSGGTAREITANLDTVDRLAAEGDCIGAESAVGQVGEQVESLSEIDPELKRALEDGAQRLREVVARCEEEPDEAVDPAILPPEDEDEAEDEADDDDDDDKDKDKDKDEPGGRGKGQGDDGSDGRGQGKGTPARPTSPTPPAGGEEGGGEEEGDDGPSGGVSPGAPAGEGE